MSRLELKGLKGLQDIDLEGLLHDSKKPIPIQSISHLSVDALVSGKYQPRTDINNASLSDLTASIRAQGIIQPLIVRKLDADRYEIIAGERRWRAAKIAGLMDVPAIIRNVTDETALAFALIENIQRESLNPVDEALSLARLKEEFSMTHEEIAERIGRSRSAVTNLMRLLGLHQDVKEWLRYNRIEMGHARALLSLEGHEQLKLAQKIIKNNMSVRATERMVKNFQTPHCVPEVLACPFSEKISGWLQSLPSGLSSKVEIHLDCKGEGRVVIHVHSPEEVEWLVDKITSS